ncbi:MAG: glycosyltransferase family 9 protein [Acidobacteriota bacterium]
MKRGSKKNRLLDYWVGTPLLNLLATFHRRRSPPLSSPQRIGVMCSPALGDALLFSAALQDLRAAYPQAHITHLCMKQNLAAAEIIPGANARVLIDLTNPRSTIPLIRALKLDVLLDFTSWQRLTAFYTLLSGARYTVGFLTPGQYRSRGFDRTVLHRADLHEVANFRALLEGSGLHPPIPTGHAPTINVADAPTPFDHEPDLIALHLWASGQRSWLREWPEDRWIDIALRLARPETLFLITGAPSDEPRSTPFVEKLRAAGLRAEPFVSPDGFLTLTRVLRRCRLVVSVNTGVMHLSAIAGARTLAINGPNRNGRWGPIGPFALGVEAPGEGCGFLHLGFNFDGNPTDCMERTSVDQVYAAAQLLLAQSSPAEVA